MPASLNFIAVDLGASGGRVVLTQLDGGDRLVATEVHRFEHRPVHIPDQTDSGVWCWDVLAIWAHIKAGIAKAAAGGVAIAGIGIDAWGVDYALLDVQGRMIRPPVAYRDGRTDATFGPVVEKLGREAIYAATGIQFMPINTLYQLAADAADPARPLERADRLLMIPDLLVCWLTGIATAEHTLASTTQMYDGDSRKWVTAFTDAIGVPSRILPGVVDAGTVIGPVRPALAAELGLAPGVPVIAVAAHDTGCAVAATPLTGDRAAYLSSGTWSLLGVELPHSLKTPAAAAANLTNEAGVAGTTRLLKNTNGLWIIQECRRAWAEAGRAYSFEQLALWAGESKATGSVDPDHPSFASPGDMPARIAAVCRDCGDTPPASPGDTIRLVLHGLVRGYKRVLQSIESVTGRTIDTLHVVGGGAKNTLLNQLTADALQLPVIVGPVEATATGNALIQAIATRRLAGLAEAREVVRRSVELTMVDPHAEDSERRAGGN
jgi:rhamnulokinase